MIHTCNETRATAGAYKKRPIAVGASACCFTDTPFCYVSRLERVRKSFQDARSLLRDSQT